MKAKGLAWLTYLALVFIGLNVEIHAEVSEPSLFSIQESTRSVDNKLQKPSPLKRKSNKSSGTGNISYTDYFHLKISEPLSVNASVHYQTRDGTAKAGIDYIATSGTATILAGQSSVDIGVDILIPTNNNKTFSLVISHPISGKFPTGISEIVSTHTITYSSTPSTPSTPNIIISGYVVDDPIQNANISLFSTDGKLLKENIKSNTNGYFEIKLDNVPDEYIVYSRDGQMGGTSFDGELFAFCQSPTCNLTPLSTVTYQYANSLLEGTFTEKYIKAQTTITEYLGISSDDLHKISGVSSFKFDVFRELAKNEGFTVVIGGLVNDLVDGYIDEEKYQTLFVSVKKREANPITVTVEPIVDDETKEEVSLTVKGIDGGQSSKGYMSDIVATTKKTIINDDLEEVEEDVTVYYSFNLGEYKGKLNVETTVLSNLFTSDIELALLPSVSKVKLIELLKTDYKVDFDNTIENYKNFLEISGLLYAVYEDSLSKLLSDARLLVSKNAITSKLKVSKVNKKTNIFLKSNKVNLYKTLNYRASSNVKVKYDYEDKKYKFKVDNTLPIYFGIRDATKNLSTIEKLTTPLVKPSSAGGAGILLSKLESDKLNNTLAWISGKKNEETTTIEGEIWDKKLFPTSASKPITGEYSYEIHKGFAFDSPTIMNITQIAKPIIAIVAGGGMGKGAFHESRLKCWQVGFLVISS